MLSVGNEDDEPEDYLMSRQYYLMKAQQMYEECERIYVHPEDRMELQKIQRDLREEQKSLHFQMQEDFYEDD